MRLGALVIVFSLAACGPNLIDGVLLPDVGVARFISGVTNPFLPLPVGATWAYQADTADGLERVEVEVLADTRDVNGIEAVQVKDTATLDGTMIEDTTDWYAQDEAGNVWYLGEDTCEFEAGACASHAGSWEFGVDDALPGWAMPAEPTVDGQPYFQEYQVGEAEDVGEVMEVGATQDAGGETFSDCVRTHDTSAIEAAADETKTYCRGVGLVLTVESTGDSALVERAGL